MEHQQIIQVDVSYGSSSIQCLHCQTMQTVQLDEEGGRIDQTPCHAPGCKVQLCEHCPQFLCSDCGLAYCTDHRIRMSGLELCAGCAAVIVKDADQEYEELVERDANAILIAVLRDTLHSELLFLRRFLEKLISVPVTDERGHVVNRYAAAQIPDWELRQRLEEIESALAKGER